MNQFLASPTSSQRLKDAEISEHSLSMSPWSFAFKRIFDFVLALFLLVALFSPMLVIALLLKATSEGPALHWSKRVGRDNVFFRMPKFRTMRVDAPQVATHLFTDPSAYITRVGAFLRKTSLDELPQIYSILKGDLSFVGPRPALFNQSDLIALRTAHQIHKLMPGLTGWAQINGRDKLTISEKVRFECEYLEKRSFYFDLIILVRTLTATLRGSGVKH
jgi:O-antigen biosynthesis protein WbqP